MPQYFWRKNGPRDYRVYVTQFGCNSLLVSIHVTKRAAIAMINLLNRR